MHNDHAGDEQYNRRDSNVHVRQWHRQFMAQHFVLHRVDDKQNITDQAACMLSGGIVLDTRLKLLCICCDEACCVDPITEESKITRR